MDTKQMSTESILKSIETLQQVQQTNPPTSKEWQEASTILNELFGEMAKRTKPAPKLTLCDWRVGDQYACIGNGLFVRTRARKNRRG